MATKRLPDTILVAVSQYYVNRSREGRVISYTIVNGKRQNEVRDPYKWDKEKDFDRVAKVARKQGFFTSASAGTFFFTPLKKTFRNFYVMDDTTYPLAEAKPRSR